MPSPEVVGYSMEQVLSLLNQMESDGVIGRYAIGGAIAAIYYVEPFATQDIDVFVGLPETNQGLLTVSPIYEYLKGQGFSPRGDGVEIAGWPVQFLPVFTPLLEEALGKSVDVDFRGASTRLFRAEHLVAIMLDTGRPKDLARICQFLDQDAVEPGLLRDVIARHALGEKWKKFVEKFPAYGKKV